MTGFKMSDFEPHILSTFEVSLPDGAVVPLKLFEVADKSSAAMTTFSLLFKGGREPVFRHGNYIVRNDAMGEFQLFLGPVQGGESDSVNYQAVFSSSR